MMTDDKPWYDQVPSLRRALLLLKPLPDEHRELIAKQVIDFARSLALTQGNKYEHLGYDKVRAMMQTKLQSQAFSNDPYLLKALNETYNLDTEGRHQVGLKILLCVQAIDNHRKDPGQSGLGGAQARITLHNIVSSVFNHEMQQFEAQGERRRQDRVEAQQERELLSALPPADEPEDNFAGLDEVFVGPDVPRLGPLLPEPEPPYETVLAHPIADLQPDRLSELPAEDASPEGAIEPLPSLLKAATEAGRLEVRVISRDLKLSLVLPSPASC